MMEWSTHLPTRAFPEVRDDEPVSGSSTSDGTSRRKAVVSTVEATIVTTVEAAVVAVSVTGRRGRTTTNEAKSE